MSDPLSIASGIAGLVTHADAVFSNVYQYAKAVQNAEKEIKELVATVQSLSGLLHSLALVLAELEKDTTESNFRLHHINSCRATLSKIQRKLNANDDSSTLDGRIERALRKLKWPFSQPETKQLVVEIEQHKATINVALSADGLSATLRALSRQDDLKEEFENMRAEIKTKWAMETHITLGKERRKVLAFFGKSDPTFSHEASLRLRHPLTGLWVSEGAIFKTWLYTRNSKLWLSGIPGAGKTVLAASLIEEAVNESSSARAVAYFYCDYKDVEKQFPVNIMGSLAVQLARQNEEAFILLQELYKTCSVEDQPPHPPRLSSLEETLYQMTTCFEDVSIIIDGLDECGNNVSTLVESITSLVSPDESNTRLLVLSRDLYEIRGLLLSSQNFSHLDIAAQSEDLKLYVAAEIDARLKRFGKNQLRIKSPELKAHILETLVDRADGMFRWVACQLDYLCGLPGDKEKRQALMSLPPDLNKTYERILEAVDHSEKSAQRLVKATLQWIVHGMKPLTVDALCEAISLKSGDTTLDSEGIYDEEDILLHCSSLIRRSAEGSYFELAHFTVKEFLEGISPESPFASYSQTESYVYPQLAATCLTYVNLEIFHDDVVEDDEKWDAQQKERPFRQHAVSNWLGYMKHSWDKEDVVSLARRLFDPSKTVAFLAWTRDYFLFDDEWDGSFVPDIDARTTSDYSALHLATFWGTPEVLELLIDAGADIEAKFQPSGGRAIHGAINCKRPDTLQVLLRHGCQLNADSQGMTPELFAFRSGNKELIRIIQEHTTRQGALYLI
ncbi:hypothetical protein L207DRAFT_424605 [Hyaloscypha variabilis F]|uniref:Uncharacterized protein n=1 Tax=Hyaloscypha variabilis (strain UAMH 11265 / GT02V1 / F) TaxID=1149755 RepID=A0A2J6RUI4_HYAVF|nr:hypothetical protein L207DRAFT_424605 [Hyaloscypha variabilis F]